uniref:Uncharacterized protein n=1 Tax=Anguilla anguilla TaxID=7936 RepID=A0A0E9T1E4_ANGAN
MIFESAKSTLSALRIHQSLTGGSHFADLHRCPAVL